MEMGLTPEYYKEQIKRCERKKASAKINYDQTIRDYDREIEFCQEHAALMKKLPPIEHYLYQWGEPVVFQTKQLMWLVEQGTGLRSELGPVRTTARYAINAWNIKCSKLAKAVDEQWARDVRKAKKKRIAQKV